MILYASALLPIGMFELLPTGAIIVPLGIGLGAVVMALIIWATIRGTIARHKKTIAAWQAAAEELGISFTGTQRLAKPSMEGRVAGFQVKATTGSVIRSYPDHPGVVLLERRFEGRWWGRGRWL